MFKKKSCKNCKKKISNQYEFCPYCGDSFKDNSKNNSWGMLGKNDFAPLFNNEIKFPTGLNMIFNSLMKGLNKQFRELDKEMRDDLQQNFNKGKTNAKQAPFKKGISINISTSGNRPPKIRVNSFGVDSEFKQKQKINEKEVSLDNLSNQDIKKMSSLPKQEPLTNIRRLSNKVIYEVNLPGVKSIKNISIIKLENSFEIKALAKDKAYFKLIPISLPIINYEFLKGKLILEFGVKN